jgi:glycosyltransferase 2 family protein
VGNFFHAVKVFGQHLADVRWEFLAIALGLHLARLVFRSMAWKAILSAAYPEQKPRFRSVFGAYIAGVGVNSIVPARAGDVVKLYLIRHRIPESSYATLTPTLVVETLFDFFVGIALIAWALSLGVLPAHEVYSRLPSVDWGFLVRHEKWTAIGIGALLIAALIAFIVFLEKGEPFRARVRRGFAILRHPVRLLTHVVAPQAASWLIRIGSVYYFLRAFEVHASVHNALLAMVVDSLATLFPATPGGAGTKQGLIVFLFRGQAVSRAALLAFSVGMNIATTVFNFFLGLFALYAMARTFSFRRIRTAARAEDTAA